MDEVCLITLKIGITALECGVMLLVVLQQNIVVKKVKLKCALVQALRLCTGHTAHRWG